MNSRDISICCLLYIVAGIFRCKSAPPFPILYPHLIFTTGMQVIFQLKFKILIPKAQILSFYVIYIVNKNVRYELDSSTYCTRCFYFPDPSSLTYVKDNPPQFAESLIYLQREYGPLPFVIALKHQYSRFIIYQFAYNGSVLGQYYVLFSVVTGTVDLLLE